jgi:ATP-dependent exoDNAse (exonuclease V) beta subunit
MRQADEAPDELSASLPLSDELEKAKAVGSVAHTVLELLDFGSPGVETEIDELIARGVGRLGPEARERHEQIEREVGAMLRKFIDSDAFADLRCAKVLAKELPCIFPWDVDSGEAGGAYRAAAEGVIDLVCELPDSSDRLLVIDYKTSRIDASQADARARKLRKQGEMYARAVTLATGRRVDCFRVVFLHPGVAVDVDISRKA